MLQLADFAGEWRLAREIDDRLTIRHGRLSGTARFDPGGWGLVYLEKGLLDFPGQTPLTVRQSYLWRAAGRTVAVSFSDGRAFHTIDLAGSTAAARHDCAPDVYTVAYDFSRWPDWSATWDVTGPRKDYSMTSWYWRL
ncbi:MAG: DUF6314 family protein [Rhodobacter sp.]|nr:DUF6314 family protein [Rhodobacter sp.]